jgi:hypothetical protein
MEDPSYFIEFQEEEEEEEEEEDDEEDDDIEEPVLSFQSVIAVAKQRLR